MNFSSVEVRLFVEHLSRWVEALSDGRSEEAHAAIEAMRLRGRWICAEPAFRDRYQTLTREPADTPDPDTALRGLCTFLAAVTPAHKD